MILKRAEELKGLGADIFSAQGMARDRAEFLSETLVEANLSGHDSHGVSYFLAYSDRIKAGHINVGADPEVVKETPSSALIDGHWAPGQITARYLIGLAVEKAKSQMVSAVGAFHCNHIGRVGFYTNWAARQGVIALMFVNVGHPSVTVYGGMGKVFGTNPFSGAVPTGEAKPFLLDYATSVVAAGKLGVARAKGEKIPIHWSRDKEGNPTDDPMAVREGGWLVPFGEHKGYCLQMLMELLGAILTGSKSGFDTISSPPSPNGVLAIALNPNAFVGLEDFVNRTDELIGQVKTVKPQPGDRVFIPGEPEWESKEQRLREGIPLPESTWTDIVKLATELGLGV
jgi:LDH2 family malate/lactate/ureidoglycolate dehydrogenase